MSSAQHNKTKKGGKISSPITNMVKNWGPFAISAVMQIGGHYFGSNKIISLANDKSLLDDLSKIDFSKQYKNAAKWLQNRNQKHTFCQNMDVCKNNNNENMTAMKEQKAALDSKLSDYNDKINSLCKSYLTMGAVTAVLSWIDIALTVSTLNSTSESIKKFTQQISDIRSKYINPVLKYHQKVIQGKKIQNWSTYHNNLQKLYIASDFLKLYKQQVLNMKNSMKQLGFKSTSNAIGQSMSAYQTYNVINVASKACPGLKLGLVALMGAQALAATVSAGQAVKCYILWKELGDVVSKLDKQIKIADKMIKDLRSIQVPKPLADFTDDNEVKIDNFEQYKQGVWKVNDVVNWVRKLGPSYESIALIFKQNDINGPDLLDLDDDMLKEMGINAKLKRRQILKKIQQLKN